MPGNIAALACEFAPDAGKAESLKWYGIGLRFKLEAPVGMIRTTSVLLATACAAALVATAVGTGSAGSRPRQQEPRRPRPRGVAGRGACGGRSAQPQVPCPNDVNRMMAVLPATAPAKPQRARKILVLAATRGYVHSSIPLAAKMVEEMGKKTGAWTTDVTYDASSINEANLKQYDLIFLDSTTGTFLDDPNDQACDRCAAQGVHGFRPRRQGHCRHSRGE